MWLGLDSTDSRQGGCTTHTVAHILAALSDYAVLQAPRLVRLNPNIPFKTRGNGALAFLLGHAVGPARPIGVVDGTEIKAAQRVMSLSPREQEYVFEKAVQVVDALREPGSDSGLVAFDRPPPEEFYHAAVQRRVDEPAGKPFLRRTWGNGRGQIGATAAVAWPGLRGTWEAIGFRQAGLIGTRRGLDNALGPELDRRFPATFDNWDARHHHLRIRPASPCPVLAGVRSTDPQQAVQALGALVPERPAGWLLFWTNQASGDHLRPSMIGDLRPYDSARLSVSVLAEPRTVAGGHVFVRVKDPTGEATAAAYEPTKEFRDQVRALHPGDELEIEGGVHTDPQLIALEAFTLRRAAASLGLEPPSCTVCGDPMRSSGRRSGYRCGCGARAPAQDARRSMRSNPNVDTRFVVPACVRRHLTRPNGLLDPAAGGRIPRILNA